MAVVYIVQKPLTKDEDGILVPRFDLSPAAEYGEREFLLGPNAKPFEPEAVARELHSRLRFYTADDYLLLIGNPILIGMASAIAAYYTDGKVNFLQWSGRHRKYLPVYASLDDAACPRD